MKLEGGEVKYELNQVFTVFVYKDFHLLEGEIPMLLNTDHRV